MAVRLPVVLCQHERRNSKQAEHEERWITTLLFEDRMDATLVADLAQIELDSTDHLCLEGLRGDFVLVSWHSKELVAAQLTRLGFLSLEIVPIDGSEKLVLSNDKAPPSKRIYFLAFDLGRNVDAGLARIKELLASRSTPVFQLNSNLSKDRPSVVAPRDLKILPVIDTPKVPFLNIPTTSGSKAPVITGSRFDAHRSLTETEVDISDESDFPHIDSLMSDLDKFDA